MQKLCKRYANLSFTAAMRWHYVRLLSARHFLRLQVSEVKEIVVRNYAFHVDNCPIKKRVWKQKSYANFHNDCLYCDYHIGMTKDGGILCSGRERVAHLCDFVYLKKTE